MGIVIKNIEPVEGVLVGVVCIAQEVVYKLGVPFVILVKNFSRTLRAQDRNDSVLPPACVRSSAHGDKDFTLSAMSTKAAGVVPRQGVCGCCPTHKMSGL